MNEILEMFAKTPSGEAYHAQALRLRQEWRGISDQLQQDKEFIEFYETHVLSVTSKVSLYDFSKLFRKKLSDLIDGVYPRELEPPLPDLTQPLPHSDPLMVDQTSAPILYPPAHPAAPDNEFEEDEHGTMSLDHIGIHLGNVFEGEHDEDALKVSPEQDYRQTNISPLPEALLAPAPLGKKAPRTSSSAKVPLHEISRGGKGGEYDPSGSSNPSLEPQGYGDTPAPVQQPSLPSSSEHTRKYRSVVSPTPQHQQLSYPKRPPPVAIPPAGQPMYPYPDLSHSPQYARQSVPYTPQNSHQAAPYPGMQDPPPAAYYHPGNIATQPGYLDDFYAPDPFLPPMRYGLPPGHPDAAREHRLPLPPTLPVEYPIDETAHLDPNYTETYNAPIITLTTKTFDWVVDQITISSGYGTDKRIPTDRNISFKLNSYIERKKHQWERWAAYDLASDKRIEDPVVWVHVQVARLLPGWRAEILKVQALGQEGPGMDSIAAEMEAYTYFSQFIEESRLA